MSIPGRVEGKMQREAEHGPLGCSSKPVIMYVEGLVNGSHNRIQSVPKCWPLANPHRQGGRWKCKTEHLLVAPPPPSSTLQNTKTKAVRSQVGGAPASQIWIKLSNKLIKHNSQESVEASKSLLINRWAAKKGSLC